MPVSNRMQLFEKAVTDKGQAQVARDMGYSASAVNQVVRGKYQGGLDRFLERAAEVYGKEKVSCPVLGMITLRRCSEERRKPFSTSSPQRVQLFRVCKECRRRQ